MYSIDCVVIGAGVVGLAVALAIALAGKQVIILEKTHGFGSGISSRNSEVIHAGNYYDQNSLMAKFCVEGRHELYKFCEERSIPHRRSGKLIVATNVEEQSRLAAMKTKARANGVEDLFEISASEACRLEPALYCTGAIVSPSTGIIGSYSFMQALPSEAESHGATLAYNSPVKRGRSVPDGILLHIDDADHTVLQARLCINAAGLYAPSVAGSIEGVPTALIPVAYYAKGNYFSLKGRAPFSRLIYPVPFPGGLSTHLTLDIAGNARFGPDVEWVDKIDYDVDPVRANQFYSSIRRYWPGLQDGALQPAYSGIRPKIVPRSVAKQDFLIQGQQVLGISGLVNLFGIESPGLTSALAIANYVVDLLDAS
jgi:L-2-hydroxyglutarate oxidase LhgO